MWRTNRPGSERAGKEITLRCDHNGFEELRRHLRQDPTREQLAFALAELCSTAEGYLLRIWDYFFLSPSDLAQQTAMSVIPTRAAQSIVYLAAEKKKLSIVSFHTHTTRGIPHLSQIDRHHARRSAAYIRHRFPEPITLANIVFNEACSAFDGDIYQRDRDAFDRIDRLEILGRPSAVMLVQGHADGTGDCPLDYDRQMRIPGWSQQAPAQQRVVVVGEGGNGAHVLPLLVEMGFGTEGWIAAIDHDAIQPSNRSRTPYQAQVGQYKVDAAADYVRNQNQEVRFLPLRNRLNDARAQSQFRAATLAIIAGDNDGLRKNANALAVRYGIPLIDLGCDIQDDNGRLTAGGQIRVVIPGEGCLACQNGFDPAQAHFDLLGPDDQEGLRRAGYVRGMEAQPVPSLAGLNALTAAFAVNAVLAIVHGPPFGSWDYLRFDMARGVTVAAKTTPHESCPVCGSAALQDLDTADSNTCGPEALHWMTVTDHSGDVLDLGPREAAETSSTAISKKGEGDA